VASDRHHACALGLATTEADECDAVVFKGRASGEQLGSARSRAAALPATPPFPVHRSPEIRAFSKWVKGLLGGPAPATVFDHFRLWKKPPLPG
jgi:hypothetical protein